ncbi:MAG: sodium/proton-translocating pyrophosphatase, partial [Chitinophagales bacterium]|nr:sodium/proton-translocating pyrophosphatase [Chitinophagales bacterium]
MESNLIIYLIPVTGVIALLFTYFKSAWIAKQDAGTEKMKSIARAIAEGAMAFLRAEYKVIAIFIFCVTILLAFSGRGQAESSPLVGLSFLVGGLCSALAGYIGMRVATKANVRTTNAARTGLAKALQIAFSGGSVMGMGVVGLGILGLGILLLVYSNMFGSTSSDPEVAMSAALKIVNVITGFSFGASSIALFARVGGGIYTKAADVGADLVGKIEAGIPEDHPLNPATIADNVGDNVGDVAGMGADLFESYVGAIVGSMVLGTAFIAGTIEGGTSFLQDGFNGLSAVLLPIVLGGVGILTSIIGTFFVRVKEGGNPQKALNSGAIGSSILMVILSYFIITWMLPAQFSFMDTIYGGVERTITAMGIFLATIIGLLAGVLIGLLTEYYTGTGKKPVIKIVQQSGTGAATN